MKKLLLLIPLSLLFVGCTTINLSCNISNGNDNKPAIKTDSEQTPTTKTNTALPVSVGTKPNSTATVTK